MFKVGGKIFNYHPLQSALSRYRGRKTAHLLQEASPNLPGRGSASWSKVRILWKKSDSGGGEVGNW